MCQTCVSFTDSFRFWTMWLISEWRNSRSFKRFDFEKLVIWKVLLFTHLYEDLITLAHFHPTLTSTASYLGPSIFSCVLTFCTYATTSHYLRSTRLLCEAQALLSFIIFVLNSLMCCYDKNIFWHLSTEICHDSNFVVADSTEVVIKKQFVLHSMKNNDINWDKVSNFEHLSLAWLEYDTLVAN